MTSHPTARTVGFRPDERNVFFHILTACNLSCRHCYINPEQHGTSTLDFETIEKWLALFADPRKETNIIFLGGEPTLHPELAPAIQKARDLGYSSITVDSNGYLFHDFLDRVSPDDLDFLSFSLDGPAPEINDPIRGDGVYRTCTENMLKAVRKGFNVSVIYTVSRMNINHLHRMPELLKQIGVKRFFIQVIGIRGQWADKDGDDLQLTPEEWISTVPKVAEKAASMGIRTTFPKVFLEPDEIFECAGNVAENYFIFPNGRVYLCPLCEDHPINTYRIEGDNLIPNPGLVEEQLFTLDIPEGCVMNKLLQPGNLYYDARGKLKNRISCCLLKQEISPQ